MSQSLRLAAI